MGGVAAAVAAAGADGGLGTLVVGVEGTACACFSTFGAADFGVCAGSTDGADEFVVVRGSDGTLGIWAGAAMRAFAMAAESMNGTDADGTAGRAGVAGSGTPIGAVACGAADVWRGAAGTCGTTGPGATTLAGVGGVGIGEVCMVGVLRSLVPTHGASFATSGFACADGGEARAAEIGASVDAIGDVGRCAEDAAASGSSTAGNGKGSVVLRTARARGVSSVDAVAVFGGARRGLTSAASVAAGFAAARRSGGFGGAGESPGVGTAASAAGDFFRLRGVFGRSVSSMRPV